MRNTLDYYNANADKFIAGTVSVDFKQVRDKFLGYLPEHALILDLGCGSGRDTKCFMEQGYPVDAVDGSEELCKAATEYTGIEVKQMLFRDLNVADKYDGIWACSSILHLPKAELLDVISKMIRALKSNGVIYTSFKYGEFEGERNERYFTDFTERSFREYITEISNIAVEESWISRDVRPDRDEEKWLNLILRRRD